MQVGHLVVALFATGLYAAVACGGKAFIDDPLGAGGSGGGMATTSTNGGVICNTPMPSGQAILCASAASGGSCAAAACDDKGNTWEAQCQKDSCVCRFNGKVECTCAIDGPVSACAGAKGCCPKPFPSP